MVVERYGYGFDGAHGGGTTVMVEEWWNIRVDADYKGGGLWLWRKRWWLKIWWLIGFWQRKVQNTEQRLQNVVIVVEVATITEAVVIMNEAAAVVIGN